MTIKFAHAAAVLLIGAATSANAAITTIDFAGLAEGTAVTNQFPGLVVSLVGGVDDGPAIVTNVFESGLALTNSTTIYYPTAYTINFAFTAPVSNVSFVYNNFGGFNGSNYTASAGATTVDAGALDVNSDYYTVTVNGSGITNLALNNGDSTEWQVGLRSLSFESNVPEPQAWAMLIAGFGLVGAAMRRRNSAAVVA